MFWLILNCTGSDNGLVLNGQQAIIWTNGGLSYWCIYVSVSLNKLNEVLWPLLLTEINQYYDMDE